MKAQPRLFLAAALLLSTAALSLMLGGPAAAQLADGPWSMYHRDVCHTGQSPNLGPLFAGTPAATDVKFWPGFDKLRTSPSLSGDGKTIYFGMGFDFCSVDAATMTTNQCYLLHADVSDSSPAVAANGKVYMGDRDNTLNAFTSNPDGTLNLVWTYNNGFEGDIWQNPVIAPAGLPAAGTIYFAHDQSTDGVGIFTALIDNGTSPTVKWKYKIGNFVRQSSPAIDKHGVIYFGDVNGYVYAFEDKGACMDKPSLRLEPRLSSSCNPEHPSGPVLLGRKLIGSVPGITASPVISEDSNTLYVGSTAGLVALDIRDPKTCWVSSPPPSCAPGPVLWTFTTIGKVDQTPALGRDGTLYAPAMNGGQKRLYAVTPVYGVTPGGPPTGGALKWIFGPINSGSESSAFPVVGGDGTVYVGLGNSIYALDPATGTTTTPPAQLWTYATTNLIQSSPLIGPITQGRAILYVPSRDHNLYAISSPRSSTTTPTTCWTDGAPTGNHPPVADAGTDQSVTVNLPVTFNGAGSHDPDGDPLTVTWNFGDGVGRYGPCPATAPGCLNPTYTYVTANPAGYTATLTVSDGQVPPLSDSDTVKITVTASGGGGGPTFQDNFNRSDSDTLGPGGSGPQWAEPPVSGQYTGNLVISGCGASPCSSGQLKNTARGDNIGYLPTLTGGIQSAAANFISTDNNSGPRLGLLLRYTDARNHYRLYLWTGGTNQLRISKVVNGTETVLKSTAITPAPTVGTPFQLVVSANGVHLKAAIGAKSVEVDDATYTSGAIGVLIYPGAAVGPHIVDDFCASIGGTCP